MPEEELQEETLLSHLIELRSRLLKAGAAVLFLFIMLGILAQVRGKIFH